MYLNFGARIDRVLSGSRKPFPVRLAQCATLLPFGDGARVRGYTLSDTWQKGARLALSFIFTFEYHPIRMCLFRKSQKTKAAPRQQYDQQQANVSDTTSSVSSPDQPGSSALASPRVKDRLTIEMQPVSSEANSRPGFFNNASDVRIDHGTFVDIGRDMIINTYTQVCLGPFKQ